MKLIEYMDQYGTSLSHLARKCGLSRPVIRRARDGIDICLSNAYAIEQATNGAVTCQEMVRQEEGKPRLKKIAAKSRKKNKSKRKTTI